MSSLPDPDVRPADWEAFYRDYRKPGYVAGFEITSKLGGGMSGLVFRARRMSIGKDYAIKFLQVEDEQVRRAVLAELEQVKWFAQIDHPNLVSIEDRGEVDGIPFLVMAFAGTETLRDRLVVGRAPNAAEKDELVRAFLQACRGLAALHERSLVHFDVKPANVFLKGGVARLGDYGLSKLVTHSRGSLSMGRGTPYYMAPELLQRRGDHRSDVYSAGVLLYEILCGQVPFRGDSEWEVLRQHEVAAPALPDHLGATERAVLQRCLHKDPDQRYQGVHDLIAALGGVASAGAAVWTDFGARDGADAAVASRRAAAPTAAAGASAAGAAAAAANDAQRVGRSGVERQRTYGARRGFSLLHLRQQHGGDSQQRERALEVAKAVAVGRPAPRRRRRGLGVVANVLAALLLGYCALMPATMTSVSVSSTVASSDDADATGGASRAPLFAKFELGAFRGIVHTAEPEWAGLAGREPERARVLLLQHIEQLRRAAPLDPDERQQRPERLPRFEDVRIPREEVADIERLLAAYMRSSGSDRARAEALAARAPQSLVVAAQSLHALRWQERRDFDRARRLQRWLEQTTGCDDLPVLGDAGDDLAELARANRTLGQLWLWFVNEFAHTPRAWAAYRQLLGK